MTYTCEACGRTADSMKEAGYQLLTGWVPIGRRAATPKAKRLEQRFACRSCVSAMANSGLSWEQPSIPGLGQ
jgi:hypothetical protein